MQEIYELTLTNFRCHSNLTLHLPTGMSLLSGDSGSGKSTVFDAIQWCLYGKVRGIKPLNGKGRTAVSISTDGFSIERKTDPGLFTVTIGEDTYNGDVAQEIVVESYGNACVWEASSYIKQRNRCLLISESNKKKMELLTSLTFAENPKDFMDATTSKITSIKDELEHVKREISKTNTLLDYEESKCGGLEDIEIKNMEDMQQDRYNTIVQINTLEKRVRTHLTNIGTKASLEREIRKLQKTLDRLNKTVKVLDKKTLDKYKEELRARRKLLGAIRTKNNNITRANKIRASITSKPKKWSNKEIERTAEIELDIRRLKKCLKDMGINYSCDFDVVLTINNLEKDIVSIKAKIAKAINANTRNSLIEDKIKLGDFVPITQEEVDKLQIIVTDKEKALDVLLCPSCDESIRYKDNKLVLANEAPATEAELDTALRNLDNAKDRLSKSKRLDALNKSIESITNYEQGDLQELNDKLNRKERFLHRLRNIPLHDEPDVSSKKMREMLKSYELTKKLDDLPHEKDIIDTKELEETITKLDEKVISISRKLEKKQNSEKSLNSCKKRLSKLVLYPNASADLNAEREYLQVLDKDIENNKKLTEIKRLRDKLQPLEDRRKELIRDLEALQSIYNKADDVANNMLAENCDSINSTLQSVLSEVFNDPISVKLSMTYKLKTTGRETNKINISILYRGSVYTNIRQLSGGEGDRVSLALTLALSKISSSPFILLDEVTPSLDEEIREKCRNILCKSTNKIVIVTGHKEEEGQYTNVLNLH